MNKTDIKEFMRGNDIFRAIEVALENIRVGQGDAVFDGLQNGKCTVDLSYNGAYIAITAHPTVKTSPAPEIKPVFEAEPQVPQVIIPEEEVATTTEDKEPEQRKRRRYTS